MSKIFHSLKVKVMALRMSSECQGSRSRPGAMQPMELDGSINGAAEPDPLQPDNVHPLTSEEGFSLPDLLKAQWGDIPHQSISASDEIAQGTVHSKLWVPEEITRDTSVMLVHGYAAKAGAYSGLARFLASHGIVTGEFDAVMNQRWFAGLHPKHAFNPLRLVRQEVWGTVRGIQQNDKLEVPKIFSLVGHSMGGDTSTSNAHEHPDSFDSVVMIDPAALAKHNTLKLVGRMGNFVWHEVGPTMIEDQLSAEEKFKLAWRGLTFFLDNPLRAGAVGLAISNRDMREDVGKLKDVPKKSGEPGIRSAVVLSPEDTLLPSEETAARAADVVDLLVRLPRLPGIRLGHLGPINRPEIYGTVVQSIFEEFDQPKSDSGQQEITAAPESAAA